jgi:hypothetical protein
VFNRLMVVQSLRAYIGWVDAVGAARGMEAGTAMTAHGRSEFSSGHGSRQPDPNGVRDAPYPDPIWNSSNVRPCSSLSRNHAGCFPRPDHTLSGISGSRYFTVGGA